MSVFIIQWIDEGIILSENRADTILFVALSLCDYIYHYVQTNF